MKRVKKLEDEEALEFWKSYSKHQQTEESITDSIQDLLSNHLRLLPDSLHLSSHQARPWIQVITAIITSAEGEKIDRFDLLYRYADPESLLDGDVLRLVMATGSFE